MFKLAAKLFSSLWIVVVCVCFFPFFSLSLCVVSVWAAWWQCTNDKSQAILYASFVVMMAIKCKHLNKDKGHLSIVNHKNMPLNVPIFVLLFFISVWLFCMASRNSEGRYMPDMHAYHRLFLHSWNFWLKFMLQTKWKVNAKTKKRNATHKKSIS